MRNSFPNPLSGAPTPFKLFFGLVAAGIIVGTGVEIASQTGPTETVRVTVTDKERQVTRNGDDIDSKYIVFTDKEVFENTDNWLKGKFNSSDVQGQLQRGQQYDLEVNGFRNQYISHYRNIISAKPVAPGK